MPARNLFGDPSTRTTPPLDALCAAEALAGIPDLCSGLFGEPSGDGARQMRDYYRLLAIRAQARS